MVLAIGRVSIWVNCCIFRASIRKKSRGLHFDVHSAYTHAY
jgi:hypothetical protein